MEADWFEDPLGRFDGRFFDGQQWTERVSQDGVQQRDPDFLLAPTGQVVPASESAGFENESSAAAVTPVVLVAPAVGVVAKQVSRAAESPVRTVAVLDESVLRERGGAASGSTTDSTAARNGWRWIGLALAVAAAALIIFALSQGGGESEPIALDVEIDERVEALEAGGLADPQAAAQAETLEVDATESGGGTADLSPENFGPDDVLQLGEFRLLNGVPLLQELGEWHRMFADERNVELGADAGCWFGRIGEAAVGVVHCGPVAGDADTDYLFDLVLIDFDFANNGATGDSPSDGGVVVQPLLDDVTVDAVRSNAVELLGYPGGPTPP